jgi:alkyldihydroxyacetonephosphate synthase
MLKILDVDDKSRLVRVQAGVSGPQLAEVLGTGGWMLGQEPQSFAISTVGGWLATRACGQLSSRYGGIEDAVAALEVVLPGGRVLGGKTVPRRAAGSELWKLMIGSEGTLGIITDAVFRFSPVPAERVDRCLRFDHMADGVTACRSIAQSETHPTVVRLYDKEDSAIFLRNHPDQPEGPLLLLSFDGDDAERRATRGLELAGGTRGDDGLVGHWWAHRNDAVAEFRKLMEGNGLLGPHGIVDTMEVSGTWSVLRELYHSMKKELSNIADIAGCHLSHVYPDGACLYFTLASATADDTAAAVALDSWWDTGMRACLDAGGSISHHHGIGRLKAPWLAEELGGWWDMLKDLKKVIDPNRIMNPGALGL